jgi:sugar/nucleoside kinase (ribokinase family)
MRKYDVVGVGIACMDYNATVTSIPRVDENVMMTDYRKQMGGTVSTALATFQRLGMKTRYMGMLGDDEHGKFTLEGMRAEGIDVSSVRLAKDESSPFSFVMVDSMSGRRSIAYFPGCSFTVPVDCVDSEVVQSARMLHVDISTPAVFAACNAAKEAGVTISVEANAPYPGLEELLATGNIFITSQEIMSQLSNEQNPVAAGKSVKKEYALDLVVVTCGAEGSIAVGHDRIVESPGFKIDVVDTTGAGDVFHGAYLYGHLMEWEFEKVLRFANAAAAIMCTGQNGWADIPTLQQVEDFLREHDTD